MSHLSEQGAALITVFMVIVVLMLLGTALAQYSLVDSLHVIRDEKRMQAYYLARSGADAVRAWVEDGNDYQSIIGMSNENDQLSVGEFHVDVRETAEGIVITGIGQVDGIEQRVTHVLALIEDFPEFPDPDLVEGVLESGPDGLEWSDNSGQLRVDGQGSHVQNDSTALNPDGTLADVVYDSQAAHGIRHEFSHYRDEVLTLTAGKMYFSAAKEEPDKPALIVGDEHTLVLSAEMVAFDGHVVLDGKLSLTVSQNGIILPDAEDYEYGVVYFREGVFAGDTRVLDPGAYYYPSGVVLPDEYWRLIKFSGTSGFGSYWR